MTRDYRRGAPPRSNSAKRQQRCRCVWWFLFGALLGAFGSGLYWTRTTPVESAPQTTDADEAPARPSVPVEPDFSFPQILRDAEVEIDTANAPSTTPSTPAPAPTPAPPTPVSTPDKGRYAVQVGSFRRTADAEKLRAELGMLGIKTYIQTVTLSDGQTFNRVQAGPYDNKQQAERIQGQLKRNGRDALMRKVDQ